MKALLQIVTATHQIANWMKAISQKTRMKARVPKIMKRNLIRTTMKTKILIMISQMKTKMEAGRRMAKKKRLSTD